MSDTAVIENFKTYLTAKHESTEYVPFQFGGTNFASDGDALVFDNEVFPMTTSAFGQFAGVLDLPIAFTQKMPDDLLEYNVNYLLNFRSDNNYTALVEDGVIRSFMSPDSPRVSSLEVFSALEEVFESDYDLKYVKLNDGGMSFSILPHEYKESLDGSNLFGGLSVSYSDSWKTAPSINTYIWRELCANGMIESLKSKKFRVKDSSSEKILAQVQEFARLSLDALPLLFEQYEALLGEKIDDYVRVVSRVCSQHRLSSKVKDRLLFWAKQDDFLMTISDHKIKNMHDIVNLFTFVGSHDSELPQNVRETLLAIGGSLTSEHAERCGSCGGDL